MNKKEQPITGFSAEEREDLWDEVYAKEEGVILEFEPGTNTGKIRSLRDGGMYAIDSRELVRGPRMWTGSNGSTWTSGARGSMFGKPGRADSG